MKKASTDKEVRFDGVTTIDSIDFKPKDTSKEKKSVSYRKLVC